MHKRHARFHRRRTFGFERLESRRLLAVDIDLLMDVNTASYGSHPANFDVAEEGFYFTAVNSIGHSGIHELWRSDGTAQGTSKVKELTGEPTFLKTINGIAYFAVDDPVTGSELWKSNGTPEGTILVKDIVPGPKGSHPYAFTYVNGTIVFAITHPVPGRPEVSTTQLWRTDGSESGTHVVADLSVSGRLVHPTPFNGNLVFATDTGSGNSNGLWASDGTTAGTRHFAYVGITGSFVKQDNPLPVIGGKIYFLSYDRTLWQSDGTEKGTTEVPNVPIAKWMSVANGHVYLTFYATPFQWEVWRFDGVGRGQAIGRFYADEEGPRILDGDGTIYIYARSGDSTLQHGLWRTDGTLNGVSYIADAYIYRNSQVLGLNGTIYYGSGVSLLKSDGTPAGSGSVVYLSSEPKDFISFKNRVYFTAEDKERGRELWVTDGTTNGTRLVRDVNTNTQPSHSTLYTVSGDKLYFVADDDLNNPSRPQTFGYELYVSDGTRAGTRRLTDIVPGPADSRPSGLTDLNGTLLFFAPGVSGPALWKTNGTAEGTQIVREFRSVYLGDAKPVNLNGALYFSADDGVSGPELWSSDGTAAGTTLVKDIWTAGTEGSLPRQLTRAGNTLYFAARHPDSGLELWKSDGTETGTLLVSDLTPGSANSPLNRLSPVGNRLFFTISDREVWVVGGGSTLPRLVKTFDIIGDTSSSRLGLLTAHGNRLVFRGPKTRSSPDLWWSDGTMAGTASLSSILPIHRFYSIEHLTSVGPLLYFTAVQDGRQTLWRTDYTPQGTFQVADLSAVSPYFSISSSGTSNGSFFLTAKGPESLDLWKSSGDAASTLRIARFTLPFDWIGPEPFVPFMDGLFFPAGDRSYGVEPRRMRVSAHTPTVTPAITLANVASQSGLVVSRNSSDGGEVSHVKITGITGGRLYLNDGLTEIREGQFVSFSEGAPGFKFMLASGVVGSASFMVQASTSASDAGLGGEVVRATITVLEGLGTAGDDNLTLRASSGATTLEVYTGNPPAAGSQPIFSWPVNANVPLPINTLGGDDTIVVDLLDAASGPAGGLRIGAGSGNNQIIVRGGRIHIDSVATGGTLDATIEAGAHVTTSQLKQNGLTLEGTGRMSLLPNGGTSVISTLTVGPEATLNIGNNALVIDYAGATPVATVREKILSGRGGAGFGAGWNGTGITSSTAAQANATEPEAWSVGYAENAQLPLGPYRTFRGQPVDETAVLIAYTRTGDANLDGSVNDDDVTIVGATYAPGVPKPHWALGDFDYNGFVDDDDVTLLGVFYEPAAAAVAPLANYELQSTKDEIAAAAPLVSSGGVRGEWLGEAVMETFGQIDVRGQETRAQRWLTVDEAMASDDELVDLLAEAIAIEVASADANLSDTRLVSRHRSIDDFELWPE